MAAKLTPDELRQLVLAYKKSAVGVQDSELSVEREEALDYYFGREFGNEVEGRSKVVERVLMDTVEWAMPQVMRVLSTSDELARFDPEGPEDEEAAKQETEYVNRVIMDENNGFILLHDVVKEILLLRNGYAKHYWDDSEKVRTERYTGLTEDGLVSLFEQLEAEGAEVDVIEQIEREVTLLDQAGNAQAIPVWDCKLRIRRKVGRVIAEAVPASEILVSPRAKGSLQQTDFVAHHTRKTRTYLIEMGMDEDFVNSLPAYNEKRRDSEELARDPVQVDPSDSDVVDRSMEEVDYIEAYIRADMDGDGRAELRKVILAGERLPPGAEWYEEIDRVAITSGSAIRMPHRHTGISLFDLVKDLQLIKSTITRQMLDNVYLTNNQRPAINKRVKLADIMTSAPGAPIRIEGEGPVSDSLFYVSPTPILSQILPVLDYLDNRQEQRTGIGKNNTVMNPDVLRDSAKETISTALSAANQRIEMIVRMIAETFVKDLVKEVHGLLIRHQDKPKQVKLRGGWVEVDPREWHDRDDMSVTVGLGMGSTDETRQNLMMLATVQEKAAQAGIVLPNNVFALAQDIASSLGFKQQGKYFTDPSSPEFQQMMAQKAQQGQANPLAEAEQVKAQAALQIEQIKQAGKDREQALKAQIEQIKEAAKNSVEIQKAFMQYGIDIARLEKEWFEAGANVDLGQPGMGAEIQNGRQ